jgi:glycosyltransferase involved in cell wall biosynthesis
MSSMKKYMPADPNSYKVVLEKEYYPLSREKSKKPILGCLMMLKNEEARILESLTTCKGYVDCFIIYDTGSTDNTIQIITDFCDKHSINVYIIQGEFINFSKSRNVSLDYADTREVHFLLLLDCSDELRGGAELLKFLEKEKDSHNNAYLMCQEWLSGNIDKYFNTRLLRARKGWRYHGSVHEWCGDTTIPQGPPVFRMEDNIVLYQDRTKDNNKSGPRFARDKALLLQDYADEPLETRTLFYLAQTCSCVGDLEEALFYYKLRSELDGFQEEKFHAFQRSGEISEKLGHVWSDTMSYYIKAAEHSERAEPLVKIAQHYISERKWFLAYTFIIASCSLLYPTHLILFVDKRCYDYTRWHLLGIVGFYVSRYAEGKQGCLKAIEAGVNCELDTKNLEFYLNKEKESQNTSISSAPNTPNNQNTTPEKALTKTEFIQNYIVNMQKNNPKMKLSHIQKSALLKWKTTH